jgi:hypothetical protein
MLGAKTVHSVTAMASMTAVVSFGLLACRADHDGAIDFAVWMLHVDVGGRLEFVEVQAAASAPTVDRLLPMASATPS